MTRERARSERRDVDKERGEPLAGGAGRGGPRALRDDRRGRVPEWTTRPRILVTNDDGVESRGLLALKQALEPMGDVTVVAPDTNQSAVGHQKTLMRPLRVRERTLGDGSTGYSVDGSPTDAVSLAFLGYFGHGFDLVASGINYGANLGDDITYSGTVSAAMEAVINSCPAFAISQEYYEHPDFTLAGLAATIVARNILDHGLSRGELINVNVPAVTPEECEGIEVTRLGPAGLLRRARRAARPARHPLLLDRRPATVRAGHPGHGLPRGRQPPHRGHADPPRPDRPAPAAALKTWAFDLADPGTDSPAADADRDRPDRPDAGRRLTRGVRSHGRRASRHGRRRTGMDDLSSLLGGLGSASGGAIRPSWPDLAGAVQDEGGLDGLVGKLQGAGLGDQVDSWVGGGAEPADRPEQLGAALGPDEVQRLSSKSGIDIAALLPDAGRVPAPDHRHADARRARSRTAASTRPRGRRISAGCSAG